MKAVILAGGLGTRIGEEAQLRPKPMIDIGGKPILWHIMKIYAVHGLTDFIVCCGYKGYVIKEYFANYFLHTSDVTFDIAKNQMEVHHNNAEPWRVTLIDTGEKTMTGGRIKRVRHYLEDDDFCLTYGDGLSDVNIADLISFHRTQRALATVTAVRPPGRFGMLEITRHRISRFEEKPDGDNAWINGGYFVLSPAIHDYIAGDDSIWEREPMERLAAEGNLFAYPHHGFWQCMDTPRDRNHLEDLWNSGKAPWKIWA